MLAAGALGAAGSELANPWLIGAGVVLLLVALDRALPDRPPQS